MRRELLRDVVCGGGMFCKVGKNLAALLKPGIRIKFAKHELVAGFMQDLCESELAAVVRLNRRYPGPAGNDISVARDVLLGIAAVHAQRMKLHGLAGEIFV